MNIKTSDLKKISNLAINGCGQNAQIPITELFGIYTVSAEDGNYLVIGSTDTINYLYARTKIDSDEVINVCVNANTFNQLVNKFTTEEVKLTLEERSLKLVANGEYQLEITIFDNGDVQHFPSSGNINLDEINFDNAGVFEIETEKFKQLKLVGENALAQKENEVDLHGYYISDTNAISTNRKIMVSLEEQFDGLSDIVLRSKLVDLICLSEDNKVQFYNIDNTNLLVLDSTMNIYSTVNSPVENYPSEAIKKLIHNSKFAMGYSLSVSKLSEILDRISLMVTKYDSDIIELTFVNNKLTISSMKGTGKEDIDLEMTEGVTEEGYKWQGKINCQWLKEQLSTFESDKISLFVDNKICIKLTDKNITKLITLA